MVYKVFIGSILAAVCCTVSVQAQTQTLQTSRIQSQPVDALSTKAQTESLFARDRNISVLERSRPEYNPLGIKVGQFLIRPRLDLTAAYTDNVFALGDGDQFVAQPFVGENLTTFLDRNSLLVDQFQDQDDLFFIIRPSLTFQSKWRQHQVSGGAYVEAFQHIDFDDNNIFNAGAYIDGRLDVLRNTFLTGGFSYDSLNESRKTANSVIVPIEPIQYRVAQGYVGAQREFGRFKVRARLTARDYDFDDVALFAGTAGAIPQGFRDRLESSVLVQADYALTRDAAVFIRGTLNDRDYDVDLGFNADGIDLNRSSQGYSIAAGVDFDITKLIRGSLAVGYNEQDYESDDIGTVSGLNVEGTIAWFPTELTTVSLNASRGIKDSAILSTAGIEASSIGVRVDHELTRNILLNASATYGQDDFQGIDRTDDIFRGTVGGTYLFNRWLSASLSYAYDVRDSNVDPMPVFVSEFVREYETNEVYLTLTFQR